MNVLCVKFGNNFSVGADAHIGPLHQIANLPKASAKYELFPRGDVGIAPYGYRFCR